MYSQNGNCVLKNGKPFARTDTAKEAEIILNALLAQRRNEGQRRAQANVKLAELLKPNFWTNLPILKILDILEEFGFAAELLEWETFVPEGGIDAGMDVQRCNVRVGDVTYLTLVATVMESGRTELVGYLS